MCIRDRINDDIPRADLKAIAEAWQKAEPELAGNSNEGGWHSRSIEKVDLLPPNIQPTFNKLLIELDKAIDYCSKSAGFPKLVFQNLWININPPGAYHTLHNHQDGMLSGVFYIDVPEENQGDLQFYRGDDAQYYIPDNLNQYNTITSTMATYPPKPGMLVVFPSWVKHAVKQNRSKTNRIALSFNYGVEK